MLSPPKDPKGPPDRSDEGEEDYVREKGELEDMGGLWDMGSPLYDSFELVSLSHLLDRRLMSFTGSPASASTSETKLSGWFFQSQASSAPPSSSSSKLGDPVGPGHNKKSTMVLLSGLVGGFTRRKREVEDENEMKRKEALKSIKASFRVLSSSRGSFAFWRK